MNDIKTVLKQTIEIVLDPELKIPERLQPIAFGEVFKLLTSKNVDHPVGGNEAKILRETSKSSLSVDAFYKNLIKREDISGIDFRQIFDYSGRQINLIMHPIPGNTQGEIEKNAGLILLFAYKMGLSFDWLEASFLRKALQTVGLGGTNFSTNMRSFKPYILPETKHGDSGYRITIPGERRAIEIFREFIATKPNDRK